MGVSCRLGDYGSDDHEQHRLPGCREPELHGEERAAAHQLLAGPGRGAEQDDDVGVADGPLAGSEGRWQGLPQAAAPAEADRHHDPESTDPELLPPDQQLVWRRLWKGVPTVQQAWRLRE